MLSTLYYFMQVTICSGILMLYYGLVLRNKKFHSYNRFYLLFAATASWLVPLIKINWQQPVQQDMHIVQLLNVVANNNTELEYVAKQPFSFTGEMLVTIIYAIVCLLLFVGFTTALLRIYKLLKRNSCHTWNDVKIIVTNAKGTPFSFFKFIFWNEAIGLDNTTGKQMLEHELVHVREKHSIDKIFIQIVLIAGWFNPFFWLIKKELNMIHEFIADNKSVQDGDTSKLAAMLLTAAYPGQAFSLTNPFFFSPIKRRLLMLTNNKNPRLSYARRVIALPLMAIVVLLFAFRKKEIIAQFKTEKKYVVVIDAGHGGHDNGAVAADGSFEKDYVLALSKTIKALNNNDNIEIVLTRADDVFMNVKEKADKANALHADLFISLHMDNYNSKSQTEKDIMSGFSIYVPNKTDKDSKLLGSSVMSELSKSLIPHKKELLQREQNIYVLKAAKCPAILIECGFVSNILDVENLKRKDYQKQFAQLVLNGINNYLGQSEKNIYADNTTHITGVISGVDFDKAENKKLLAVKKNVNDNLSITIDSLTVDSENAEVAFGIMATETKLVSMQESLIVIDGNKSDWKHFKALADANSIQSISYTKKSSLLKHYQTDKAIYFITTKQLNKGIARKVIKGADWNEVKVNIDTLSWAVREQPAPNAKSISEKFMVILNGEKTTWDAFKKISPNDIESINIIKDKKAIEKYGANAKEGVIEIVTKKIMIIETSKNNKKVQALSNGIVSYAGKVCDNFVVITRDAHNNLTTYNNLTETFVTRGQTINMGQNIGITN